MAYQVSILSIIIMFTINVQDQIDLLLQTLMESEVVTTALDQAISEDCPLDLSIKKEDVLSTPSRSVSRSSSSSSLPDYSPLSSPMSVSSNSNDSLIQFDMSLLPESFTPVTQDTPITVNVQPQTTPTFFMVPKVEKMSKVTCTNCSTQTTSTWRKDKEGRPLCNACGLYLRVHGVNRPAEWGRFGTVMRRNRKQNIKKAC